MSIEEINNLPSGWVWSTLGEICEKSQYGWTTKADHSNGSLKLLRTTDITSGEINWDTVPFCTESPDDVEKYLVKSGDVLISRAGSVGVSFLINNPEYAVFASYLIRFRPKAVVATKYFYFFLKSPDYWAAIGDSKAGIAVPNVNASKLSEVQIPLAPLAQQTRIVAEIEKQFSRLDEAVANLKRVKANLKRYKAAVLKAAVEGKLTEEWRRGAIHRAHSQAEGDNQDVVNQGAMNCAPTQPVETGAELLQRILAERRASWQGKGKYKEPVAPDTRGLPALPAGWVWASMPQIGELNRGKSKHRPRDDARLYGGQYPFIQTGEVRKSEGTIREYNQTYSEFGLHQSKLWPSGTLCITIAANIAETGILTFAACFPDSIVGFLNEIYPVTTRYVEFFIRTAKGNLERFAPATAQKNINLDVLQNVAVPLPPLDEQQQIVAEVERRLSIVAEAEAQVDANLRRADRLRQSILKQAFSGQLVPQNPNDEPASVLLERIRNNVGARFIAPGFIAPKSTPRQSRKTKIEQDEERAQSIAPLQETIIAILAAMHPGREYSRADLAEPLGLATGQWNAAIQELKRQGKVRQVGEKRGARYLLVSGAFN